MYMHMSICILVCMSVYLYIYIYKNFSAIGRDPATLVMSVKTKR